MSQTSKRPGAHDISDLKARLGLKKTGGAPTPAAPQPTVPAPGAPSLSGNVPVPSPGGPAPTTAAKSTGNPTMSAPSPGASSPGFPNTAPGFGAPQSAPKLQTPRAPAPDIVVVNDGRPVESLTDQNKGARIGKTAAMILAPLIAGVMVGKVGSNAAKYNAVIEDAAGIRDDVSNIRKGLTTLESTLESAAKHKGAFVVGDPALTKALKELVHPEPAIVGNDALVYKSALYHLKPEIVAEIYGFYSDLHLLERQIKLHVRDAQREAKILTEQGQALAVFHRNQGDAKGLGAVLRPAKEEGEPAYFDLVQLGGAICPGETKPNPAGCKDKTAPVGFAYRADQTGQWRTANLLGPDTEGNGLVMLDPSSKMLKQVVGGGIATVAEADYKTRLKNLSELSSRLLKTSKTIENALTEKANESKKFSFFL